MNMLMRMMARAGVTGALALLAACSGVGEGSTVKAMAISFSPADTRDQAAVISTTAPELRMFDCFCSNLAVVGTFTDGTLANFSSRAKWSSSDTSVVTVSNFGDNETGCPFAQRGAGLLRPVPGPGPGARTAVITAEYLGFKPTFTVEVADTANEAKDGLGVSTVMLSGDTNAVAVGGALQLFLYATLDGRKRYLNNNVMDWSLTSATGIAAINQFGVVSGLSPDLGAMPAPTAVASFGPACSLPSPTQAIRVGEVVQPLAIAEEQNFADQSGPNTSDHRLAVNSNEFLAVTANLDFGGGTPSTGTQNLSGQSRLAFSDPCTKRVFDSSPTYAPSQCKDDTSATCGNTEGIPVCAASTATTCPSTLTTACRVAASPMTVFGTTNILALTASADPTTFSASFPFTHGVSTTLSSALNSAAAGTSDMVTIASTVAYPTVYPWEGVIGKATASPEVVQVTAATGTTLTVVRGYAGSTAQAWPATTTTFDQRSFDTGANTAPVTASDGELKNVSIDTPTGTLVPEGTLQLQATGTFTSTATSPPNTPPSRVQRISHLATFASGSPGLVWSSSNPSIASVGSSGLVASNTACGGRVAIRARASNSTNPADAEFQPAAAGDPDSDLNGNNDNNDIVCGSDLLCDQVNVCVARPATLPPGTSCTTPPTTCP